MSCAGNPMLQWISLWHLRLCTTPCLLAAPPAPCPPWMETKTQARIIKKTTTEPSIYSTFEQMRAKWSHMQWKQGRNRLVVTDGVAHVTSVHMLCDLSGAAQPWGETSLQCRIVGRNRGACTTKVPQDAIRPGRFPLLSAGRRGAKRDRVPQTVKIKCTAVRLRQNTGRTWCHTYGCPHRTYT